MGVRFFTIILQAKEVEHSGMRSLTVSQTELSNFDSLVMFS